MQNKQNFSAVICVFLIDCIYVFVIPNKEWDDNRFWTEKVQAFHISNMLLISSWIQLSIGQFRSQKSEICHVFKGFILSGTFTLRFYLASCSQDTDVRIWFSFRYLVLDLMFCGDQNEIFIVMLIYRLR